MKFGVTYQTSKRVGSLYMPAGPDRYDGSTLSTCHGIFINPLQEMSL
ncbi:hypothetical protein [Domibacillus tundrae]|nr:hypothetical protein [Domibacillus tundrae]